MEIKSIRVPSRTIPNRTIPRNVIEELPSPVVSPLSIPKPVTPPPPVVRGIAAPVVDVPDTTIEYPTIDLQTEQEFRGQMSVPQQAPQPQPPADTRDLPNSEIPPQQVIEIGGVEFPIPDPGPIIGSSATAVATTIAALGTTVLFAQLKTRMDPMLKRMAAAKNKKVKIKKTMTVLHFIPQEDESVQILQYDNDGVKVVENNIDNLEQYLRDQVDINSFYEYENKIIIDDVIKKKFTKEGTKRFSKHFASPKSVTKKLGAKFSF